MNVQNFPDKSVLLDPLKQCALGSTKYSVYEKLVRSWSPYLSLSRELLGTEGNNQQHRCIFSLRLLNICAQTCAPVNFVFCWSQNQIPMRKRQNLIFLTSIFLTEVHPTLPPSYITRLDLSNLKKFILFLFICVQNY